MILYIEDDRNNRMLVKRLLDAKGVEMLEAKDAYEGFMLLQKHTPQLILMDINMPGMSGYELTTKIKSMENFSTIPIVALTVASRKGEREMAIMAGCDGFISKPIDVEIFTEQIDEYLAGKKDEIPDKEKAYYLTEYSRRLVGRLETKLAEIESSKKEWENTFDALSDLIVILDSEYTLIKINVAASEYFSLDQATTPGKHYDDLLPLKSFCPQFLLDEVKNSKKSITKEVKSSENGKIFLITLTPIIDEHEVLSRIVHIAKDITGIREAQEEIERRVEEMKIFNKAAVGRELKMISLKEKIIHLEKTLKEK